MSALFLITNNLSYLTNPAFLLDIKTQYFVKFYYLSQTPITKYHHSSRDLNTRLLSLLQCQPTNLATPLLRPIA